MTNIQYFHEGPNAGSRSDPFLVAYSKSKRQVYPYTILSEDRIEPGARFVGEIALGDCILVLNQRGPVDITGHGAETIGHIAALFNSLPEIERRGYKINLDGTFEGGGSFKAKIVPPRPGERRPVPVLGSPT